jgi:hypothetical protein
VTRARTSSILQALAVVLLVAGLVLLVAGRRARRVEGDVVDDASSTVMRERFRTDGPDQ